MSRHYVANKMRVKKARRRHESLHGSGVGATGAYPIELQNKLLKQQGRIVDPFLKDRHLRMKKIKSKL